MVDILAHTEKELRKRLDLSSARITRTDRVLVILVRGNVGTCSDERCLTLRHDGRWELTGYPTKDADTRILVSRDPILGGGALPEGSLRIIAKALRLGPNPGGNK